MHIRPWCPIIPTWTDLPDLLHKSDCFCSGGFSSATSLGFYFVMSIYAFPASLLLIATGTGWGGITKRSGTDPPFLVVWASLQRHRFILCLPSSELFSQRSVFSSALRPSYFSSNLRKKLLQRFSHIWELRSFHVWITKECVEI